MKTTAIVISIIATVAVTVAVTLVVMTSRDQAVVQAEPLVTSTSTGQVSGPARTAAEVDSWWRTSFNAFCDDGEGEAFKVFSRSVEKNHANAAFDREDFGAALEARCASIDSGHRTNDDHDDERPASHDDDRACSGRAPGGSRVDRAPISVGCVGRRPVLPQRPCDLQPGRPRHLVRVHRRRGLLRGRRMALAGDDRPRGVRRERRRLDVRGCRAVGDEVGRL